MTIQKTHSLETVGGVSLATGGSAVDGADMTRTPEPVDGLGLDLLDALTLLAKDRVQHEVHGLGQLAQVAGRVQTPGRLDRARDDRLLLQRDSR